MSMYCMKKKIKKDNLIENIDINDEKMMNMLNEKKDYKDVYFWPHDFVILLFKWTCV